MVWSTYIVLCGCECARCVHVSSYVHDYMSLRVPRLPLVNPVSLQLKLKC